MVGTAVAMQEHPIDLLFTNNGDEGQGSPYHQIVAAGKIVPSLTEANHSYLTSVLCLQRAFYHDIGYIEYNEALDNQDQEYPFSTEEVTTFSEYLSKEDVDGAINWIKSLGKRIRQYDNTQVAVTKDFYLSLLLRLVKVSEERGIFLYEHQKNEGYGYEALLQSDSLSALEAPLLSKLEHWKAGRNEPGPHAIVSGIHKLITKHYPNDSLTIKDLSKELYLSTAYLCVVYKEHTGRTILQHLTEYRIDQAKQLLSIPRIKIIDVAKQVGYSNAVYFAKTFRKHTGLTPSEYRERITL
jgi:two-component system response regulator YesN